MNKKVLIGACIGLLLVVAAFFGLKQVEDKVNQQVLTAMNAHNIKASSVDFNYLSDKLTIKDMEIRDLFDDDDHIIIKELIAYSPNAESFNVKAEGLPLVAKTLTLSDVNYTYNFLKLKQSSKFENVTVSNWKQNIAKVLELKKQGYNEAYFAELFNSSTSKAVFTNYTEEGQSILDGVTFNSVVKVGLVNLQNLTPTNIGAYIYENVEYVLRTAQKTIMTATVKKLGLENVPMPSPSDMASVKKIFPSLIADNMSNEQEDVLLSSLGSYVKSITNAKFYAEGVALDVLDTEQEEININIQKLELASDIDAEKQSHINLKTDITGIAFDVDSFGFSPEEVEQLTFLIGKTAFLDVAAQINLADKKASSLSLSVGLQNAMHLNAKFDAILPDDALPSLFGKSVASELGMDDVERWVANAKLVFAEKTYKDAGILSKILMYASQSKQQTPSNMWQLTSPLIKQIMQQQLPFLKANEVDAIFQCVEKPGTLNINVKAANPLPIEYIFVAFVTNQEDISRAVMCTPGTSNIVDAANNIVNN